MTELRAYRRQLELTQEGLADLLRVSLNSLRMWDSGLRPTPGQVLHRARSAAAEALLDRELLTLPKRAVELKVHVRTLQAAARTGRLEVTYTTRSTFGRPIRLATRAAVKEFLRTHYKRYTGQPPGDFGLLPTVPSDHRARLRDLRRRLKLTQADLAGLLGAANKAVVYQWESGKRVPSPVFWERVTRLESCRVEGAEPRDLRAPNWPPSAKIEGNAPVAQPDRAPAF